MNNKNKDKKIDNLHTLLGFFNEIDDIEYYVIKLSDLFPEVKYGDDIDFVVGNLKQFQDRILSYFNNIKIYTTKINQINNKKIHIDIFSNASLILRLDIYCGKPSSPNIKLKKNYYESIMRYSEIKNFKIEDLKISVKVPQEKYELLIRIIEFSNFPFKTKHKDFIKKKLYIYENNLNFYQQYFEIDIYKLLRRNLLMIKLTKTKNVLKMKIKVLIYRNRTFNLIFLFRKKYQKEPIKYFDIGWTTISSSSSIILPIEKIFINLNTQTGIQKCSIEDSPHYKFIKIFNEKNKINNAYAQYLNYDNKEYSEKEIDEKVRDFIYLNNYYKTNRKPFELIVSRDLSLYFSSGATLLDGVHRLSIMKYYQQEQVKCYINDIK